MHMCAFSINKPSDIRYVALCRKNIRKISRYHCPFSFSLTCAHTATCNTGVYVICNAREATTISFYVTLEDVNKGKERTRL